MGDRLETQLGRTQPGFWKYCDRTAKNAEQLQRLLENSSRAVCLGVCGVACSAFAGKSNALQNEVGFKPWLLCLQHASACCQLQTKGIKELSLKTKVQ